MQTNSEFHCATKKGSSLFLYLQGQQTTIGLIKFLNYPQLACIYDPFQQFNMIVKVDGADEGQLTTQRSLTSITQYTKTNKPGFSFS